MQMNGRTPDNILSGVVQTFHTS